MFQKYKSLDDWSQDELMKVALCGVKYIKCVADIERENQRLDSSYNTPFAVKENRFNMIDVLFGIIAVSYTHLDVYKRQIGKGRHLVWIRKIEGNTNDFVMMDFNYDKLLKKIQMESGSADCYICTDDTILFSTTEKNTQKKQMKNWSDSFLKECKKETELEFYGKKFLFVLTEDHHGSSEVLNSQRYGLLLLYIMNLLRCV